MRERSVFRLTLALALLLFLGLEGSFAWARGAVDASSASTSRPSAPLANHGNSPDSHHPVAPSPTYTDVQSIHDAWEGASLSQRIVFLKGMFSLAPTLNKKRFKLRGMFDQEEAAPENRLGKEDPNILAHHWENVEPEIQIFEDDGRIDEISRAMEKALLTPAK